MNSSLQRVAQFPGILEAFVYAALFCSSAMAKPAEVIPENATCPQTLKQVKSITNELETMPLKKQQKPTDTMVFVKAGALLALSASGIKDLDNQDINELCQEPLMQQQYRFLGNIARKSAQQFGLPVPPFK